MKSIKLTGYGDVDRLQLVEHDIPSIKADEVLIKVRACAINNTEIWMREGAYGKDSHSGWKPEGVTFPRTPGSDVSGEIVKVGSSVDNARLGEKVVLFPFTSSGAPGVEHLSEDLAFLGSEYDGGYAEYVVWPAALCYPMPCDDFVQSCVFSVSGLTAWHMVAQLKLKPGETVLVTGANGGVGIYNVQLASKLMGAKVIAVVGDDALRESLLSLGASKVVSYRSKTLKQDILKANGKPVDAVLDVVGDALFEVSLEVLKRGGKFCVSGSSGGQKTTLDFRTLYLKHLTFFGSVLGTREEYSDLLAAVKQGLIHPVIDKTFPLEEAAQAQQYFKQSGKLGKIVLLP